MPGPTPPTPTQILTLYHQFLQTSSRFASYNFSTYFTRRSIEKFTPILVSLKLPLDPPAGLSIFTGSGDSKPFIPESEGPTIQALKGKTKEVVEEIRNEGTSGGESVLQEIDLTKFYEERVEELEVLRRSAEVNRMFEGPKLVVENRRPITAGGGSGAEASP